MPGNPWKIVAGTGHRELSGRADRAWTADQLPRAACWLRDRAGTRIAITGMARGFDLDWAEAALDAGLRLWAAIPFVEQPARWNRADKARWAKVRAAAERERIVGRIPDDLEPRRRSGAVNRLLFRRNTMMHDFAGALITVWEPHRLDGGTTGALLDADRRRMPGIHLDPVARHVAFALPDRDALERHALVNTRCGHVARLGNRADVTRLHTALLHVSGPHWRIRAARTRESWDDGCADCIADLAAASARTSSYAA